MDVTSWIDVEINGVIVKCKVHRDAFESCAERTRWAWLDADDAVDDASDNALASEVEYRGLEVGYCEHEGFIDETYVANQLHDVIIEMKCGRDPKDMLNKLFRYYLGDEV